MIVIRINNTKDPDNDALAQNEESFEILKNIAKELLFSGCSRTIKNNEKFTAHEMFEQNINYFN
jgi:hypothetical protein